MATAHSRLGVDIGATTAAAVLAIDAQQTIVMPDGTPVTPSGVFVDPTTGALIPAAAGLGRALDRPDCYLADPITGLTAGPTTIAGHCVDPVDVLAAVLRHINTEASRLAGGPPTAVAVAIPPTFGPRRRDLVREATQRAGLPAPDLVAAPVAVAAHLTAASPPPAAGTCVLVCDAAAHTLQLTVLQHTDTSVQILATAAVPGAAGADIDAILTEHAGQPIRDADPQRWSRLTTPHTLDDLRDQRSLQNAVRRAKEDLRHAPRAAVALPDPYPPTVLDQRHLAAATQPAHQALAAAVAEVLAAADLDPATLAAVILIGEGAHLPHLTNVLHETTGHTPIIPTRTDIAAADGALHATHSLTTTRAGQIHLPRTRLTPRHLIAPILTAAASFALLIHTVATADIYFGSRLEVRVGVEEIGAAAIMVLLCAYTIANLAPTTYLHGLPHDTDPTTGSLIRRTYTAAALLGLVIATLYGLAIGSAVDFADNTYPRWAILSAAPLAAAFLLIAAIGPHLPANAIPTWLRRTRLPLTATLLAATGIIAMRYATTTGSNLIPGGAASATRIGAAITGIGIALTITRHALSRTGLALILGIGFAAVATAGNVPTLTIAYTIAITWWALTITATTITTAYPQLSNTFPILPREQGR
ncbi:Hsp70 family protein [Solwaraspora sp. WMMD1047]|uniref:Hsp70 family protein n=1 Tax=Solwaraspora sp. WMMD1047 TaxID=3016102 RepID=UPI002415DB78|nr:Hsp70 family protein [Solwaraspora sp. WMMD1047]MDG4829990.1 Hsp70 family protein [Solwaraspora sp. WMMD1047]